MIEGTAGAYGDNICPHCAARKWPDETEGMCCRKGAVVLPPLEQPPPELLALLVGADHDAREFRVNIRRYNATFQMASSTAKVERVFPDGVQSFRINGTVFQLGAYLFPFPWCPHSDVPALSPPTRHTLIVLLKNPFGPPASYSQTWAK